MVDILIAMYLQARLNTRQVVSEPPLAFLQSCQDSIQIVPKTLRYANSSQFLQAACSRSQWKVLRWTALFTPASARDFGHSRVSPAGSRVRLCHSGRDLPEGLLPHH